MPTPTTFNYTRDIPFSTNNPSSDQPKMQVNTNSTEDLLDIDHYSFGEALGGAHKQVQMPISNGGTGSIPTGLIVNEGTLYTKQPTGPSELFYTPDTSGKEYQLTRTITADFTGKFGQNAALTTTPAGTSATGGWTFLPGGLLLNYGLATTLSAGNITVTFSTPFTTACYGATLGSLNSSTNVNVCYVSVSTTQIVLKATSGGVSNIFFTAIGI